MRLLLSTRFYPAVGGLEIVMEILANEWTAAGHEVRVVTDVPAPVPDQHRRFPFQVYHRPGVRQMLGLVKWCDVYLQGCIGLKTLWPLAVYRRRYVASHQTWYARDGGGLGWSDRLKLRVARHAINIAPSQAVADQLPVPCAVIPNPYRSDIFERRPDCVRDRDLIFVGRLVSDKGATLLLQALAILRDEGLRPGLTLVGDGPERPALERETADLGLDGQVLFTGGMNPGGIAALLNRHRVFVVPSIWKEPFGVVALEGIACGCLVVGSESGGLKDAIGPCGTTFPNGNVAALAGRLRTVLLQPEEARVSQEIIDVHLARHQPAAIAKRYIAAMLTGANR